MFEVPFAAYEKAIRKKSYVQVKGKVTEVTGLIIKVEGLEAFIGEVCEIQIKATDKTVLSEVVGFVEKTVLLMPLDDLDGIGPGCIVRPTGKIPSARLPCGAL